MRPFRDWLRRQTASPETSPAKAGGNWREKRRNNRVPLDPSQQLSVHLLSPGVDQSGETLVASVQNVSLRGCRLVFESPAHRAKVAVGQTFVASLAVEGFAIPLQVEVVRLFGETEAAIRFKPPFPRELERLEKFLEPRCLGLSMREIDSAALQTGEKRDLRWFQGVNDTNLFSWADPASKEIVQQQLAFLEHVVEWRADEGLKTGRIEADRPAAEASYGWVRTELMKFDAVPDKGVLAQARSILESARIDEKVKSVFLRKFGT